jgi:hypothetical protein
VQEVDVGAEEIQPGTLHSMCLEMHLNLELARTLRVTSSALADETRGYQLCHYDVVVAQLVATCFIKSV